MLMHRPGVEEHVQGLGVLGLLQTGRQGLENAFVTGYLLWHGEWLICYCSRSGAKAMVLTVLCCDM